MPLLGAAMRYLHIGTPATPAAGQSALYFKSDGLPYCLDPTGTERPLIDVVPAIHANPTFDQLGGSSGILEWSNFWQEAGASMTPDSVDRVAGTSVKVVAPAGVNARIQEQTAHNVVDTQTVTFGFWAKASVAITLLVEQVTGPTAADAQYFQALGITQSRTLGITTAWRRYSVAFSIPTGHLFGRFSMVPQAGSPSCTVWYDESFSSTTASDGGANIPTGTVLAYGVASPPGGYLLCDGTIRNIADYPALGGLLLATFGGNGTTTFAVPDMRRRYPIGYGVTTVPIGKNEGTASSDARTPAHNHDMTNVNHTGTQNTSTGGTGTRVNTIAGVNDGQHKHLVTNSSFDTIPHLALAYIIKT